MIPQDHGKDATPLFSFKTEPVPEPSPCTESMYSCSVPRIDSRAICFEIQRRTMDFVNDNGESDTDSDFDLVTCLESPLLADLNPELKTYIRDFMSPEERANLKEAMLEHQERITEYTPTASACLMCNTAIYRILSYGLR